jgi:uncharacterized membrane protein YeaQ/YmgE (transglycosylase-associated protein family)
MDKPGLQVAFRLAGFFRWWLAGTTTGMGAESLVWFLILLAIFGLIVGAVGRLLVPGPTPLGLLGTMGAGIAGAFIGGLVGRVLLGPSLTHGWLWVLSFLGAALVVALVTRRGGGFARGGYGHGDYGRRDYGFRRRWGRSDRAYERPLVAHEVDAPYGAGTYEPVRRRRGRFF